MNTPPVPRTAAHRFEEDPRNPKHFVYEPEGRPHPDDCRFTEAEVSTWLAHYCAELSAKHGVDFCAVSIHLMISPKAPASIWTVIHSGSECLNADTLAEGATRLAKKVKVHGADLARDKRAQAAELLRQAAQLEGAA